MPAIDAMDAFLGAHRAGDLKRAPLSTLEDAWRAGGAALSEGQQPVLPARTEFRREEAERTAIPLVPSRAQQYHGLVAGAEAELRSGARLRRHGSACGCALCQLVRGAE